MKVLIYSLNFSPEIIGIGKYNSELASWLANRGHQVRVITAYPYYPWWRIKDGYQGKFYSKEFHDGIEIFRCPIWVPSNPSGFNRLLHLVSFAMTSFPVLLSQIFWMPKFIFLTEPPFFCAPATSIFARIVGAKSWLHIQDYELDAAFGLGLLKGEIFRRVSLWIESFLLARFSVVSTISVRMLEMAKKKGVDKSKLFFLPNWIDISNFSADKVRTVGLTLRKKMDIPDDAIVALYSGNMGAKQGLEILAKLAVYFEAITSQENAPEANSIPEVYFVFCGNGSGRDNLVSDCAGLKKVRFMDLQPLENLPSLLMMADIHLLPQRPEVADLVMPSKLTGMLASGRPIIATAKVGSEVYDIVKTCGIVVDPEDFSDFVRALSLLVSDKDLRQKFGKIGYEYAMKNIDMDVVLETFENKLTSFF